MNDLQKIPAPSNDGLTQEQVRAVIVEKLKGIQQEHNYLHNLVNVIHYNQTIPETKFRP